MYITVVGGRAFSVKDDVMTILEDGVWEAKKKRMDVRTVQQNASLWLYFSLLSTELNNGGLDMKQVIKADVQWNKDSVHDFMWIPLQKAILGTESTTRLKKKDIDVVYETMNRLTSEKFGIHVDFPSVDSMIFEQNYKDK